MSVNCNTIPFVSIELCSYWWFALIFLLLKYAGKTRDCLKCREGDKISKLVEWNEMEIVKAQCTEQ